MCPSSWSSRSWPRRCSFRRLRIPNGSPSSTSPPRKDKPLPPAAKSTTAGREARQQGEVNEVELGTFNVTHFNPTANATLSIDFELFGAVLASDEKEFHTLFEKNKVRVREQIIMTLHAADAKDLSDAGLGLLKRQILEKTNRALGQPLLKEVLFSKFNFVER